MPVVVSILMPCYNQGEFLEEAVGSLIDQTFTRWECLIVNDGSEDNTKDIAHKLIEKDDRIKYFSQVNKGVCAARNLAAQKASGKYLLPLDADDFLNDTYIEQVLNCISNSEATVAYGKVFFTGNESKPYELEPYRFEALILANMIHVAGIYRKSDFDRVGGYDVQMVEGYEDWEFWINILKENKNAVCVPEATLFYRTKQVSRMKQINLKKRYNMIAYIYKKHQELYRHYVVDHSKNININLAYGFYLSGKRYGLKNQEDLTIFFQYHLNKTLRKFPYLKRKRILIDWYRRGKVGIQLKDILLR